MALTDCDRRFVLHVLICHHHELSIIITLIIFLSFIAAVTASTLSARHGPTHAVPHVNMQTV